MVGVNVANLSIRAPTEHVSANQRADRALTVIDGMHVRCGLIGVVRAPPHVVRFNDKQEKEKYA